MNQDDDEFDYSDTVPQVSLRSTPPRLAKRKEKHVQVPLWMFDALVQAGAPGSTWAVLLFLLFESWRTESKTIKLPNQFAETLGISHDSKVRGLRELERLGVVKVDWRGKKSPLVTVLDGGTGTNVTASVNSSGILP
jgi:hypothetical protein